VKGGVSDSLLRAAVVAEVLDTMVEALGALTTIISAYIRTLPGVW
jgi:hypothetical protein